MIENSNTKISEDTKTQKITTYITDDGSISFRNNLVDEMYHTKSGAVEESFEKHARPLEVWKKNNPVIYDVCFGIGYNAAAAVDLIRENNNYTLITIYCFENDKDILEKILEINPSFKCFNILKIFINNFLAQENDFYEETFDDVRFIMIFGDVRDLILCPKENADFVFFDPFSPKKDPELWNKKLIGDVYSKMNKGAKLSTYSYARLVRETFKEVGFTVIPGPIIGRKSPSTIAIKE